MISIIDALPVFEPEQDEPVSLDRVNQSARLHSDCPFTLEPVSQRLSEFRLLSNLPNLLLKLLLWRVVADFPDIMFKLLGVDYATDFYHSFSSLKNASLERTPYLPSSMSFQASSTSLRLFRSSADRLGSTFFRTIMSFSAATASTLPSLMPSLFLILVGMTTCPFELALVNSIPWTRLAIQVRNSYLYLNPSEPEHVSTKLRRGISGNHEYSH